jgi:apolipoprotein N-acyltransferase
MGSAGLAYLTGVVSSLGILYWVALVVVQYGGLSYGMGFLVLLLLCLAFSLFTGGFGLVVGILLRRWGPPGLLGAPLAWVAFEILRTHVFFSFPWCLLGYSQWASPAMIQIAPFTAVYGVSFALVATSSLLATAALAPRSRLGWGAALGALLLPLAVYLYGLVAIARAPLPEGSLRVGLVQGNIPEEEKWQEGREVANLMRHEVLTRRASASGARLVVWPESALSFYFDSTPTIARELKDLVSLLRIRLVFGNDDADFDVQGRGGRYFVGAKMLDPSGTLSLRYHKIHLVPFGEYVPLKGLLAGAGVGKLVQQVSDFTPGDRFAVGEMEGRRLAVFICYEAIFPDLVRRFPKAGAELLVNITNDAWYGTSSAPFQHFAAVVFRAVENRRFVIRAANTGITAIVDPTGQVRARLGMFESTVLVRDVGFVTPPTFYALHGDLFAWGCLLLTGLLCVLPTPRGRP